MNSEKLLVLLLKAQSEHEVEEKIIAGLDTKFRWKPLGGTENNYSTISNQQSDPINALVEKLTNSFDALLLKYCKIMKIDPTGKLAPKTMQEATKLFCGYEDFSDLNKTAMHELAGQKLVSLFADGTKQNTNLIIADRGEGQSPDDFPDTLLSLLKGNKKNTPFVQGKYNMGGTGVLLFCGKKGYQLILSRKSVEISGEEEEWGFTLIREKPDESVQENDRYTWYEFLTDQDGKILRFPGRSLKILENFSMQDGCLIKLYNYDIPPYMITSQLWKEINARLFQPSFPIHMNDQRPMLNPNKTNLNIRENYGLKHRFERDQKNYVSKKFSINVKIKKFGIDKIDVVLIIHASQDKKKKNHITDFRNESNAILFTQNGQTQHTISQTVFKTKTGFNSLSKYIVVHIDLTNIPREKARMFLANREQIRKSSDHDEMISKVFEKLSSNSELKLLDDQYRKLDDENTVKDSSMQSLIQKIVKKNPSIMKLLKKGETEGGEKDELEIDKPEFTPNYFPTFLNLEGTTETESHDRKILSDGKTWSNFIFKTDAPNDYLTRENDKGQLNVEYDKKNLDNGVDELIETQYEIFNGTIKTRFRKKDDAIGPINDLIITLTRTNDTPLIRKIKLYFGEKVKQPDRESPTGPKKPTIKIPEFRWVREKDWPELQWNQDTVAEVGEQVIRINRDYKILKDFKRTRPSSDSAKITGRFGFEIFFQALMLFHEIKEIELFDIIFKKTMTSIAKACLPLVYDFNENDIRKLTDMRF